MVDIRACVIYVCMSYCGLICSLASTGSVCGGVGVAAGSGKGSNHKHLNLQMALMSCAKQPVLTDEPVNPG